jgi:hypothetical protein
MTPKEKAIELTNKFYKYAHDGSNGSCYDTKIWTKNAKQCSLIAVDEILKSHNNLYGVNSKKTKFYLEIKQEIEKL